MRFYIGVPFVLVCVLMPVGQGLRAETRMSNSNPLAAAAKAVGEAAEKLKEARRQMLVIHRNVELVFETRPEFNMCRKAMEKAKSEYNAARQIIISKLEKHPEYAALMARREETQAIIDGWIGVGPVKESKEGYYRASHDNWTVKDAMEKMETEAENGDPGCAASKEKYVAARGAWDAMQAQVEDAMKLEPGYPAARKAIDDAQTAFKQARERYATAAKTLGDQDAQWGPIAAPLHRQGNETGNVAK